jgi:hypothetical protein
MFAYSQITDTRMLALVGNPKEDAYELLFSFSSPVNKAEFLRLLQSNDATACEEFEILVPDPSEIEAAQPIARVLPADVMRQVIVIAAMLFGGELHAPARDTAQRSWSIPGTADRMREVIEKRRANCR